jgi:ornithine cyclodeaminase
METTQTLPFIAAAQVRNALPYPELIDGLREAFRVPAIAPQRHAHELPGASSLLVMPAWQSGGEIGVKLVTVMPDNRSRALPTVHALYVLMDADTGAPLALMDGEWLTLRRTGAVSALASRYLSREDSRTLLMVGSGRLAPEMVVAHCAARAIERVLVWGRDTARVAAAMQRMREAGLSPHVSLESASALATACAQADIICCATTSTEPLLTAMQVRPGTHVDLVGGFRPTMREADDALICTASLFVDTLEGALAEAGDLVQPMAAGLIGKNAVRADLSALVRAEHPGRQTSAEITLFKSVGTAVADLGAARLVRRAVVQG